MHRHTLNINLDWSNLRERCEFAAERCCLSLTKCAYNVAFKDLAGALPHYTVSKHIGHNFLTSMVRVGPRAHLVQIVGSRVNTALRSAVDEWHPKTVSLVTGT